MAAKQRFTRKITLRTK